MLWNDFTDSSHSSIEKTFISISDCVVVVYTCRDTAEGALLKL